jgi:hypothetical protein
VSKPRCELGTNQNKDNSMNDFGWITSDIVNKSKLIQANLTCLFLYFIFTYNFAENLISCQKLSLDTCSNIFWIIFIFEIVQQIVMKFGSGVIYSGICHKRLIFGSYRLITTTTHAANRLSYKISFIKQLMVQLIRKLHSIRYESRTDFNWNNFICSEYEQNVT